MTRRARTHRQTQTQTQTRAQTQTQTQTRTNRQTDTCWFDDPFCNRLIQQLLKAPLPEVWQVPTLFQTTEGQTGNLAINSILTVARSAGADTSQPKQTEDAKMEDPEEDQVRRSMRLLREDVDHQSDRISDVARQTLWTMSQQVSQARKEAASQIVVLGFHPPSENANALRAMEERDVWLRQALAEAANIPQERVRGFTASHSTNMEYLSRLSLLTFSEPHVAAAILRNIGARKLQCHGQQLMTKRQVTA